MGPNITAMIRDALDEGAEFVAGKALLVAAPLVFAAAAGVFLAVAGYGALSAAFGPVTAALALAAMFAALAVGVFLVGRARSERRRQRAAEARARLVGEISALRAVAGAGGALAPVAALVAAFALGRRS
jgi:hypothetical protein